MLAANAAIGHHECPRVAFGGNAMPRCVLLVEDDEDIRETLTEILRAEDYDVVPAKHGAEALDLLSKGVHPCVAVVDLMMPVLSGWELIGLMRADQMFSSIPIVVTSAFTDKAPSADRVIPKPLNLEAVLSAVGDCCKLHRHASLS